MKLLLDFNNLIYASFFADLHRQKKEHDGETVNSVMPNMVRHLFFSKLLFLKKKFKANIKDIHVCIDHKITWRRDVYKYYKSNRAKSRRESDVDFEQLFDIINALVKELQIFPLHVHHHKYLEGDDWIAILAEKFQYDDRVIVVSTDKDFYQLQKFPNLSQFHHIKNTFVEIHNPENELISKILLGDSGDGIPNVMSDDDVFINENKRQKRFGVKSVWKLLNEFQHESHLEMHLKKIGVWNNYIRNKRLIDLSQIPKQIYEIVEHDLVKKILPISKIQLAHYFHKKNLNSVGNRIGEFFI